MSEVVNKSVDRSQLSFTDRQIPKTFLEQDYDVRRRSRLLIVFSYSLMAFGSFYSLLYFFVYKVPAIGSLLVVATILTGTTPLTFRLSKSLTIATYQLVGTFYSILLVIVWTTAGLSSGAVYWMTTAPVMAMVLLRLKHGIIWLGINITCGISLYIIQRNIELSDYISAASRQEARLFAFLGLSILVYLLVRLFETNKTRMLNEIKLANQETERLRNVAEEAHQNARLVLDSVNQGLVIVNFDGTMQSESSSTLQQWFGPTSSEQSFWEYLKPLSSDYANWIEAIWLQLSQDIMPPDILLRQLPSQVKAADQRFFSFQFQLIPNKSGGKSHQVMVVITDISEKIKAEIAEESRREMINVIENLARNRYFTNDILDEIQAIIDDLASGDNSVEIEKRMLHTLKGSSAISGLISISSFSHQLEDQLVKSQGKLSSSDVEVLSNKWRSLKTRIDPFLRLYNRDNLILSPKDYEDICDAINSGADRTMILKMLEQFRLEPLSERFVMMAEHAKIMAQRIGKNDVQIQVEDNGVRLTENRWSSFWSNFTHAVRNAVDHGIESSEERQRLGKEAHGQLVLSSCYQGDQLIISISDDGRGIDWNLVRNLAKKKDLPHSTLEELEEALFVDGFTTSDEVSELSGRGVGMGALRQACAELGGKIEIATEPGKGTNIRFVFPRNERSVSAA